MIVFETFVIQYSVIRSNFFNIQYNILIWKFKMYCQSR